MNEQRRTADLTQEEESLLLCPNPYTCGDHSLDDRPPEVLLQKWPRMNFFPEEPPEFAGKVVVHMSCCSCNKLAIRWTDAMINISRPKAVRVTIDPHKMNILPGVTIIDNGHKSFHPTLFADLLLYAGQKFGVASLDQILLTRKVEPTPPDLKFDVIMQCSHCGNRGEGSNNDNNLLKCGGICGGKARYCNASCQKSHRSIHKHECWRKADTDTFTIPHPNNRKYGENLPLMKIKAYHQLDGYNRSGINLTFTESYPMDPMEPDGDQYPKNMTWAYATTPIDDESGGRSLEYGEAVFNTTKHPVEVNTLLEMGIIKDTGKKLDFNYCKQHPICRINLPVYRNNEYTDNDNDDDDNDNEEDD